MNNFLNKNNILLFQDELFAIQHTPISIDSYNPFDKISILITYRFYYK